MAANADSAIKTEHLAPNVSDQPHLTYEKLWQPRAKKQTRYKLKQKQGRHVLSLKH